MRGSVTAPEGFTRGLVGQAASPQGVAGYLDNFAGGRILLGRSGGRDRLLVTGTGDVVSLTGDFRALGAGRGLVLVSPDGHTCVRLSIANDALPVFAIVSCPRTARCPRSRISAAEELSF